MLTATLLTLAGGALHATWNLLIKSSADRLLATWGEFLIGGLLFLPLLALTGPACCSCLAVSSPSRPWSTWATPWPSHGL